MGEFLRRVLKAVTHEFEERREECLHPSNGGDRGGFDPFRYAPGRPFRSGKHPSHLGSIWRRVGRWGKR